MSGRPRATAVEINREADEQGFPSPQSWESAPVHTFCTDWQGRNPDPQRETRAQLLWSHERIYVRFECRYREITVFPDSEPSGRRNQLWERDVAEVFFQPNPSRPSCYLEFEVSPRGQWIDLAIDRTRVPHALRDLKSGLERRVQVDEAQRCWAAELAIPMKALTNRFEPRVVWRVNFFRVEGKGEPRFYGAWSPTNTPAPNFHVPEAFGELVFRSQSAREA